jgi:hypothetical protein
LYYQIQYLDASGSLLSQTPLTATVVDSGVGASDTSQPPTVNLPVITSFASSPSSIPAGQSATLSWVVTGANTVSINQGIGTVTAASQAITPAATTVYILTATNSAGSVTAQTTVTVVADTTPPVISSIASSAVTDSSATITWSTDKSSDTQVDYGPTASYGANSALASTLTTVHRVDLANLVAGTTYHYRVKSRDAFGNLAVSADNTVNTSSSSAPPNPPAGAASWPYRKRLTIDHTKISGASSSSLSNFPVLVSMTDPDLKKAGKKDGSDILFKDASGNKLNHELEQFDQSTGQIVAWVRIPQLSATSDTTIYVYYGNTSATDQQDAAGAWDSGFQAVLHLADSPSAATFKDSTGKGTWTGSNSSLSTGAGQIGGALTFGGNLAGPDIAAINAAPQLTYSAWINPTSLAGMMSILSKGSTGPNTVQLGTGGGGYGGSKDGSLIGMLNNNPTGYGIQAFGYTDAGISVGAWTYVTMVFDGGQSGNSERLKIYLNGSLQSLTYSSTIPATTSNFSKNIAVANGSYPGSCVDCLTFKGAIDEVRVSSTARTSDWIQTEYNNQSSPGTFMSASAEESVSSAPASQ